MKRSTKKIERRIRKMKKKQADRELKEKMNMFSQLEDSCLVCEKPFDKKNKEMVQSWYVVVRKEQNRVNLYCPECWGEARSIVITDESKWTPIDWEQVKEEMNAKES
jgi:DNA repair exonuclease SbcCD ATPase subunit|tara:strand:+ start:264 stop:584 length:321 start_codon:yes stop_codon:yes gene_type:complete